MAEERGPAQTQSGADDSVAKTAALEARIAQLEQAFAALQSQVAASQSTGSTTVAVAAVIEVSPPPALSPAQASPPPPPVPPMFAAGRLPSLESAASPQHRGPFRQKGSESDGSAASLESQLGSQIFNRIAIVLLLIGTAYGLKLAVDRGWLGPVARVAIGLFAGAALVLWSERFRAKGFAAFSYSLKAVGSGVLYLSLWAAFRLFHLIPASAALCLMVLVTAWNTFMAWVQDSELLAAYAIAGGFATPMLLSTGGNHETFLFTYIIAIDVATIILVRLRGWPRLLLGAFPLTVAYFVGWYVQFWDAVEFSVTSIFIALFAAAFASVPLGSYAEDFVTASSRALQRRTLLEDILLPLCNAAFAALAFYSVLRDSGHHALLPWLMVALAAIYLALMRAPQTRTASAIHLSLAVVFLTIAVPLKASGHWITVSWLVEGLALMWVATRLSAVTLPDAHTPTEDPASAHAARVLRPLASASLLLGFCGVCVHAFGLLDFAAEPLWNNGTGTALIGIAAFAATAWLALRASSQAHSDNTSWSVIVTGSVLLIDVIAAVFTLRELASSWQWDNQHPAFRSADFITALIGLAVFAGVIAVSLRLARQREHAGDAFWPQCAALSAIAFNLVAVLTGVREVSAAFAPLAGSLEVDAALQQALAISAWLMLYGVLLLAAGFWRRSSFLRWQALGLLAITILKAFLYDMRDLSGGYRFVSLIALGALLLAVSFAYQKDWLNLRDTPIAHRNDHAGGNTNSATHDAAASADPDPARSSGAAE